MIRAVGIGPGDPELLTLRAKQLIQSAEIVAGFEKVLGLIKPMVQGALLSLTYQNQFAALAELATAHRAGKQCVLCFMGDPSFSGYQLLCHVERACGEQVEIVPGISAVQIASSRARVPLDEAGFVSFHKRGDLTRDREYLLALLGLQREAIVIPRPWDFMPGAIANFLMANDIRPETAVTIYEKLTIEESEWHGDLRRLGESDEARWSDMSIVVIRPSGPESNR